MQITHDRRTLNVERATPAPPHELIAIYLADSTDPEASCLFYLTPDEARRVASRLRRLADRLAP